MHRLRVIAGTFALIAGVLALALMHGRSSAAQPHSCGMATFAQSGVVYRILFAKNGAVQQYLLAQGSGHTEKDHDVLKAAMQQYGPEAVNAPPLQITSFKPGSNGMMVPDKAVDSCGRVTHFH
jgi:hypothetical protein